MGENMRDMCRRTEAILDKQPQASLPADTKLRIEDHCEWVSEWVSEWVKVAQSCLTLCNPTAYTAHGILQARILEWVALDFPSPGDLPNQGIKPKSPTLQADSLPAEPQGKPKITITQPKAAKQPSQPWTDIQETTAILNLWTLFARYLFDSLKENRSTHTQEIFLLSQMKLTTDFPW